MLLGALAVACLVPCTVFARQQGPASDVDPVPVVQQALSAVDNATAALASAKASPGVDKALQELAVARVRLIDALRIARKAAAAPVVTVGPNGERVEVRQQDGTTTTIVVNPGSSVGAGPEPRHHGPLPHAQGPMAPDDFEALLAALKGAPFSSDKLVLVRDAAKRNRFETDQVLRVVKLFSHGSEQVDAAVAMYPRVVDKKNFFKVYGVLSFSSDRDSLRKKVDAIDQAGLEQKHEWSGDTPAEE